MYGFSKKRGRSNNYYYHPCFVRKQPHLITQITRRVENKTPKPLKASTVSIEDQIAEPPSHPFLKINQVLFLEQCANLQLILNEVEDDRLREGLSAAMKKYLENQNRLLQRVGGGKEKEINTAGTLQENGTQTLQKLEESGKESSEML